MAEQETKTTPNEFFGAIGQKVESTDDEQLVDEIESLCMNCGQNVCLVPAPVLLDSANICSRDSPACS